jgi:hypothetical protein
MPALAPKPNKASRKAKRRPERRQFLGAHVGKGVVAGIRLKNAEAQQDADGADMRDQQIEVAGTLDLDDAMIGGNEKERRQGHRLPHHHERVGVVGEHHQRHAGEKSVVLKRQQTGWRAFALAEIAGGEGRHPRRDAADDQQEEGRQAVEAKMERQTRQPDRQHGDLGRVRERTQGNAEQQQTERPADRKQHPGHQGKSAQGEDAGDANQQPRNHDQQHPVKVQPTGRIDEESRRAAHAQRHLASRGTDAPKCSASSAHWISDKDCASVGRPARIDRQRLGKHILLRSPESSYESRSTGSLQRVERRTTLIKSTAFQLPRKSCSNYISSCYNCNLNLINI